MEQIYAFLVKAEGERRRPDIFLRRTTWSLAEVRSGVKSEPCCPSVQLFAPRGPVGRLLPEGVAARILDEDFDVPPPERLVVLRQTLLRLREQYLAPHLNLYVFTTSMQYKEISRENTLHGLHTRWYSFKRP